MVNSGGPPPEPKRRRRWPFVLLAVAVVLALPPLMFWWMLSSEPSYWQPVDANDTRVRERAARVESEVSKQTTEVRPPEDRWSLVLTEEEINAWLAARLPRWLANQGVDDELIHAVPHAMAEITADDVELAAEVHYGGLDQIVRFVYRPVASANGEPARLELQGLYAGRVPIPLDTVVEQLKQRLDPDDRPDADQIRDLLRSVPLTLRLADRRTVKIVGVELSEGLATLTCVTEHKPRKTDKPQSAASRARVQGD